MTRKASRKDLEKVNGRESLSARCSVCDGRFDTSTKAASHARRFGHDVEVASHASFTWRGEPDGEPAEFAAPEAVAPVELVVDRVVDTALGLSAIYYRRKAGA